MRKKRKRIGQKKSQRAATLWLFAWSELEPLISVLPKHTIAYAFGIFNYNHKNFNFKGSGLYFVVVNQTITIKKQKPSNS